MDAPLCDVLGSDLSEASHGSLRAPARVQHAGGREKRALVDKVKSNRPRAAAARAPPFAVRDGRAKGRRMSAVPRSPSLRLQPPGGSQRGASRAASRANAWKRAGWTRVTARSECRTEWGLFPSLQVFTSGARQAQCAREAERGRGRESQELAERFPFRRTPTLLLLPLPPHASAQVLTGHARSLQTTTSLADCRDQSRASTARTDTRLSPNLTRCCSLALPLTRSGSGHVDDEHRAVYAGSRVSNAVSRAFHPRNERFRGCGARRTAARGQRGCAALSADTDRVRLTWGITSLRLVPRVARVETARRLLPPLLHLARRRLLL